MKFDLVFASRTRVLFGLLIISIAAMSLISPYFLNLGNILTLMRYSTVVGLLALGQALVILGGGGGIDLSIGSTMSLCSVVFGLIATHTSLNIWIVCLITITAGGFAGCINGFFVSILDLPPLIVTLGTMYLYSSLAQVMSGGTDISGFDRQGFNIIGQTELFGIPMQVLVVFIPIAVLMAFVANKTVFGRDVYAIGSGDRPAQLAGVPLKLTRVTLYCISGLTAALGSIVTASWLLNARSTAGNGYELQAVTIAVLGGIAITGGIGKIHDVILAVILMAILNNGLQLAGIDSTYQLGLLGLVLVVSMLIRKKNTFGKIVV